MGCTAQNKSCNDDLSDHQEQTEREGSATDQAWQLCSFCDHRRLAACTTGLEQDEIDHIGNKAQGEEVHQQAADEDRDIKLGFKPSR